MTRAALRNTDVERVAAIVVAHNGGSDLLECIESLVAQRDIDLDIVVIDNASVDGSILSVEDRFGDRVRVVRRATNDGYAAGANAGRLVTDTTWIGVFNQDLILAPTAALISPLLRLKSRPEHVNAVGNDVHWSGVSWCRGAGSLASSWSGTVEVPAISGAAFLMRTAVFDSLGGLDESFFMYMEDVDLSLRARSQGLACVVACDAQALHDWRLALTPEKFERLEANRRVVWERHLSGKRRLAFLVQAELMAWLYAGLRGRRHIQAKLRSAFRPRAVSDHAIQRVRIEQWLSTHHPYDVMYPGRTSLHALGHLADRIFLKLAGDPHLR
jgi:GT2 family glycosyltransferase